MSNEWISIQGGAPVPTLQKILLSGDLHKGAPVPGLTPLHTTPAAPQVQPKPESPAPPATAPPKK